MKEKLEKFIKDNNLTFEIGERNTNLTVLCGYSLYLTDNNDGDEDLIYNSIPTEYHSEELREEFNRVYDFAYYADYGDWGVS